MTLVRGLSLVDAAPDGTMAVGWLLVLPKGSLRGNIWHPLQT